MFSYQINEELYLRMLSARDAEPLFHLINESRQYLTQWLPWVNEYESAEDCLEFIKGSFYNYNNRKGITSGIYYHDQLVGIVGFNELNFNHKHGSIGYWLGENYQGKGIMTQSVKTLIS